MAQTTDVGRAFIAGIIATVAMSLLMGAATLAGVSPLPEPVPAALAGTLVGTTAPAPLLMGTALLLHLAIGGGGAAALAQLAGRITYRGAFGLALVLWLIMQVAVLPFLGWGLFGSSVTPRIAMATLVPHLVYGGVLGWWAQRQAVAAEAAQPASNSGRRTA